MRNATSIELVRPAEVYRTMRFILATFVAMLFVAAAHATDFSTKIAGTDIEIEMEMQLEQATALDLVEWVRASAESVTLAYGRFPTNRVRVVLRPSRQSWWTNDDAAVSFGRTTRIGGGTVELFINAERPIEEFYADWTATHEFSHLMLPLLNREHRWLSEGFATYYQNVLMARAGNYSPEYAWQRLADGFARGRSSRPDLSPNEAGRAGVRDARMKYYWAGAAFALLIDIELRSRSDGRESLDSVLGELAACCLPAQRRWSGPDLMRRLDTIVESPIFVEYWSRYADKTGFPDVKTAMDSTQGARIRDRIMQRPQS